MSLTPFSPRFEDVDFVFDATLPLADSKAVGLRHFHAVDETREDISTGKRQFMVSVFYPGQPDDSTTRARLVDILSPNVDAGLELLAQGSSLSGDEKMAAFARLKSLTLRAQRDLEPLGEGPLPVLIYYPGGLCHRLSNAALCERFASRGYVVFALDAPRDAPVVAFPDGQLVPCVPNSDEDYIWPRVADVRCLLDGIEGLNGSGEFAGLLDLERIGMFGHSRGGYLSNICAVEDVRIKAAVNMDGFLWGLWTKGTGLSQYPAQFQERVRAMKTPVLRLLGDQGGEEEARTKFAEEAADFGGDFVSVAIHGYNHGSFSTTSWMCGQAEKLGANVALEVAEPEQVELLMGLLGDFFGAYLMGKRGRMELVDTAMEGMDVFWRVA